MPRVGTRTAEGEDLRMNLYLVLSLVSICIAILNLWLGRPDDTAVLLSGIYLVCYEISKKNSVTNYRGKENEDTKFDT